MRGAVDRDKSWQHPKLFSVVRSELRSERSTDHLRRFRQPILARWSCGKPCAGLGLMLRDGLDDAFSGKHSGWHTEDLVAQAKLSREAQDRFAERSQRRFSEAQKAGKFRDEIVSVQVQGKKGIQVFDQDEAPRPDTTLEGLAKLRPAFRENGTITAGNSPGLNSGAGAVIVADRTAAEAKSVVPVARLVGYGGAAVEPGMFGLGPVPAVRKALDRAGWKLGIGGMIRINAD